MHKPLIFTLFGATGDLALRKVLPAIFALYRNSRLPRNFTLIAFSRRPWTDNDYRSFIKPFLKGEAEQLENFLSHVVYTSGTFQDTAAYITLAEKIKSIQKNCGQCQKMFYLAIQPEFYKPVLDGLSGVKALEEVSSRILVEKPFGHDEESAEKLEKLFEEKIKPEQLLHIDHYLAKDGFRNVVVSRKKDKKLEAQLSREHVASINVCIRESLGIEDRGEFYEHVGALLDVGQNHLLEMLAVLLMDISDKNENRARAEALQSLRLTETPILGQYEGYRKEKDVDPNSSVETYVKFGVMSSLPRWKEVPIVLETGKAMAEKKSVIAVHFKNGSKHIFDIQSSHSPRDAYETVFERAISGTPAYFAGFSEIRAAWRLLDPILKKRATLEVKQYSEGTNGPIS